MSFLAPIFLAGALAVTLPVLFHLVRRTTRERTVFSSLMFLLPSPPRLTRRSRLEHLFLLLLRCAVLCLLAVGFARPFIKTAAPRGPASGPKRLLLLLDTSASMRRANLWADALTRTESILRQASPVDQVAVLTFDQQVRTVVSFEEWQGTPAAERAALALRKIAVLSPGWFGTQMGNALMRGAEILADANGTNKPGANELVLLSDLQEGGRLEPLQGYEWPRDVALRVEALKARHANNAGLQLVADGPEDATSEPAAVRVRVVNASEAKKEQFKVGWARDDGHGLAESPVELYVPPGQSRIVPLTLTKSPSRSERILLQGDDEDFDNTVFALAPEAARLNVVYIGTDAENDPKLPLYFLQRAFQESRRQSVRVLVRRPGSPLPPDLLHSASLLVANGDLPDAMVTALRDELSAGKSLLFMLESKAQAQTLARLLGLERLGIEEVRPENYAMLAEIDFRHPLLAPFAEPRFSDFTKIHFWKYYRVDPDGIPGARSLAKFDSGAPALLEIPVGKGRVFLLASGWEPESSQLALSTKFVPLLYSMLDLCGAPGAAPVQYRVGDVVPLGAVAAGSSLVIRSPAGSEETLAAGETNFSGTSGPGIYTIVSSQPPRRFAVNLEPAESRTTPMPVDEFERLGAPLVRQTAPAAVTKNAATRLQNAELEGRQKLWRWLIVAALVLALVETGVAGRAARRLMAPAEAGSSA